MSANLCVDWSLVRHSLAGDLWSFPEELVFPVDLTADFVADLIGAVVIVVEFVTDVGMFGFAGMTDFVEFVVSVDKELVHFYAHYYMLLICIVLIDDHLIYSIDKIFRTYYL